MCFPTVPMMPSHNDLALPSDLVLPSEWDHDTEMLNEEELSATSHEEASKVLELWQTDDQDLDIIMEVDEQIGSNLLDDDIFGEIITTSSPMEEIVLVSSSDNCHACPLDERYKATLLKLQESMRRTQDTRKALYQKSTKMEQYARRKSLHGVLSQVEKSSRQVHHYLRTIQVQA